MPNEPDLSERDELEFKVTLDPMDGHDRLRLVEEIVAMANTKGGRILIGVDEAGTWVGVPDDDRSKWDAARIGDLIDKYIDPERVEVSIAFRRDSCPPEKMVVELLVPQHHDPPLVISRDASDRSNAPVLRRGAILVRNNTKVEAAARSDFVRWRKDDRDRIFEGISTVILNPGSVIQVDHGDQARHPASYLLSRSVDLFRRRADKLLDGDDLLFLFANRDHLDTSTSDRRRLLLHSALRRRATLYFWLALLDTDRAEVARVLDEALNMRDRDKSDMSGAVPLVAALYLPPSGYQDLVARMATSRYAHIRDAAERYPTPEDALEAISTRRKTVIDGRAVADLRDEELLSEAERTAEDRRRRLVSRRMPALGLEYLARRLGDRGDR